MIFATLEGTKLWNVKFVERNDEEIVELKKLKPKYTSSLGNNCPINFYEVPNIFALSGATKSDITFYLVKGNSIEAIDFVSVLKFLNKNCPDT